MISLAEDVGEAVSRLSRECGFPGMVTSGAMLTTSEENGATTGIEDPTVEEFDGHPAGARAHLRRTLPPNSTREPAKSVGVTYCDGASCALWFLLLPNSLGLITKSVMHFT